MTQSPLAIWAWAAQTFGSVGAVVLLMMTAFVFVSSILTPYYLSRLSRQNARIANTLTELSAAQNRQELSERARRSIETKIKRRRRRA